MEVFDFIKDHEEMVFINDKEIGLKAIVCIHDTTLGPAVGGCRLWNYQNETDAIFDVTRLAKGMTYKSAAAGLNVGGGKSVIIADNNKINREVIFRALGKHIEGLNSRYIIAEDVNTTTSDMSYINQSTNYVIGLASKSGNPSSYTAKGVFQGIKAAVKEKFNLDSLKGLRIAVQGLGHVSTILCDFLSQEGANLIVTDLNKAKIENITKKLNAQYVAPDEIFNVDCDILSPNALGGIINDKTIDKIKAKIIAGAANNQLFEEKHGDILLDKGILYAPDFIINAGGVIKLTQECFNNISNEEITEKIDNIYNVTLSIFKIANEEKISTNQAANLFAEKRIMEVKKLDKIFTQRSKYVFPV